MKIGLTGTFASGKGVVASYLTERGFEYFSLSNELREVLKERNIEITRENLQNIGNELRNNLGGGALAKIVSEKIKNGNYENAVIDSIRNPYEIEVLRNLDNFSLISVDAPWVVRFERIKNRNRENDPKTLEEFLKAETRDFSEEDKLGQQTASCMKLADYHIFNYGGLDNVQNEINKIIERPSWDDFFLSLAKNISTRSKDPSTKVGAVIVRPDKSICSVGFNGFPSKMPDDKENYSNREEKYSRIIHAEINALTFSRDQSHEGYSLYTWPMLSCDRCFVQMVQAGITKFVTIKTPTEKLARWGPQFEKVKKYAIECGVEIIEK